MLVAPFCTHSTLVTTHSQRYPEPHAPDVTNYDDDCVHVALPAGTTSRSGSGSGGGGGNGDVDNTIAPVRGAYVFLFGCVVFVGLDEDHQADFLEKVGGHDCVGCQMRCGCTVWGVNELRTLVSTPQ
jgi:hypothetical protein